MSTPAALGPAAEADGVAFDSGTKITMLPVEARGDGGMLAPDPWELGTRLLGAGMKLREFNRVVSKALLRGCGIRSLHRAPGDAGVCRADQARARLPGLIPNTRNCSPSTRHRAGVRR
jgi:hypothetical protein